MGRLLSVSRRALLCPPRGLLVRLPWGVLPPRALRWLLQPLRLRPPLALEWRVRLDWLQVPQLYRGLPHRSWGLRQLWRKRHGLMRGVDRRWNRTTPRFQGREAATRQGPPTRRQAWRPPPKVPQGRPRAGALRLGVTRGQEQAPSQIWPILAQPSGSGQRVQQGRQAVSPRAEALKRSSSLANGPVTSEGGGDNADTSQAFILFVSPEETGRG